MYLQCVCMHFVERTTPSLWLCGTLPLPHPIRFQTVERSTCQPQPLHIIRQWIQVHERQKVPLRCVFMEWGKAFDSLTRKTISHSLACHSAPEAFINAVLSSYQDPTPQGREQDSDKAAPLFPTPLSLRIAPARSRMPARCKNEGMCLSTWRGRSPPWIKYGGSIFRHAPDETTDGSPDHFVLFCHVCAKGQCCYQGFPVLLSSHRYCTLSC